MRTIQMMALLLAVSPVGAQQDVTRARTSDATAESHYLVVGSTVVPIAQIDNLTEALPMIQLAREASHAADLRVPTDPSLIGLDVSIDFGKCLVQQVAGEPQLTIFSTPAWISITARNPRPDAWGLGRLAAAPRVNIGLLVTASPVPTLRAHAETGNPTMQSAPTPGSDFLVTGNPAAGLLPLAAPAPKLKYCHYVVIDNQGTTCPKGYRVNDTVCVPCGDATKCKPLLLVTLFEADCTTVICTIKGRKVTENCQRCRKHKRLTICP